MKPDHARIAHLERVLFPKLHRPVVTDKDRELATALLAARRFPTRTPEGG